MTWKDIPLRKYNDIYAINNTEYEDEIDRGIDLVSIIFDVDARNIPYGEFSSYLQQITKLPGIHNNDKPMAKYTLNGTDYWMTLDYGNMTTAQYIDFQNYAKNNDLLGIVSTSLIPAGHSYNDGYDMKDLEELSIHDGMSITAFFLDSYAKYTTVTLAYLRRKLKRMMRKKKMNKEEIKDLENNIKIMEERVTEFYLMF